MQIAVIGNGLQAYIAAGLFASVGNQVVLCDNEQFMSSAKKEPGLERLLKLQTTAERLEIVTSLNKNSIAFDFILLAETSVKKIQTRYSKGISASLTQGTCFIILNPSEIGEAIEFSAKLQLINHAIRVCCVPLLVREGRALDDFSRPELIIVGSDEPDVLPKVKNLFYPFNRNKNVIKHVSTKEAEFSNFAGSAMLATRLSFMNEMASLAERSGVDIDVVRECIGSDPRIGLDYLYPGCGYGGRALSNKVEKIARQLQLRSDDLGLLNVVTKINERQKDLLFRKIWNYFASNLQGKTVAIWGASFKPGSTSISGAPSVKLIESLLAQNAKIRVYDPVARENLQAYFDIHENLVICDSSSEAINGADVLAICTEWKEFWSPDFNLLKSSLSEKAIFDGRNILDPKQVKEKGLRYFGIGRGEKI